MAYKILDIDNCIADDEWRISRINWQQTDMMRRYHDYHSLSAFDKAGNIDLFKSDDKLRIIILTARPVLYSAITQHWLEQMGIEYEFILMRNNDDHCHSVDLKRKHLRWLTTLYEVPKHQIAAAYDDRPDVIDMYIEEGIINSHVRAIHDVCAYTKPASVICQ